MQTGAAAAARRDDARTAFAATFRVAAAVAAVTLAAPALAARQVRYGSVPTGRGT